MEAKDKAQELVDKFYKEDKGFEITCDALGSSKQICGGGAYDGGIGFAIGVDRILEI